jgi:hypothetical protein
MNIEKGTLRGMVAKEKRRQKENRRILRIFITGLLKQLGAK